MLRLLFIVLFLMISSIINAAHLDAYIWEDERLKSSEGSKMYNMIKGDNIYYYYKSGRKDKGCIITIQSERPEEESRSSIRKENVNNITGNKFESKICIKPNSRFWYFKAPECEWVNYRSPSDYKIINTTASCNQYGCLTRYGWIYYEDTCDYKSPVINDDTLLANIHDNNWMSFLDSNLKLNEINIPGTHDSGTYEIDMSTRNNIIDNGRDVIRYFTARTQTLNITEQLENGIRYLDIRLELAKDKELYLCHDVCDCYNKVTGGKYYLSEVLDEIINFLNKHNKETVIIHLKQEITHDYKYFSVKDFAQRIINLTFKNNNIVPFNKAKKFKDFYYHKSIMPNEMPTLKEAEGKIVILSRQRNIINYNLGIIVPVPDMGSCKEYSNSGGKSHGISCYPFIVNNYRIQDGYNLEEDDKWDLIYDTLMNRVSSRSQCKYHYEFTKFENSTADQSYNCTEKTDKYPKKYVLFNSENTDRFFNSDDKDVLTINFMNMAKAGDWYDLLDSSTIYSMSSYVNKRLVDFYENSFHNTWFILDFPSQDVIRKIYLSNKLKYPTNNFKLSTNSINESKLSSRPIKDLNLPNNLINNSKFSSLEFEEYYKNLNIYLNNDYYIYKKSISNQNGENRKIKTCIQVKLRNNDLNKQNRNDVNNKEYIVKTNFKCINNSRNKWYFKQNNNYLNIVSAFNDKCLIFRNGELNIENCDNNNIYKDFIVKNKTICSGADEDECLNDYEILPSPLERTEEKNLSCPYEIFKLGFNCCSNSAKIDHINEIGTWGYENGELCGIPFDTLDLQGDVN